jgi:tetratricopeptide (TPR) repeat protein
MHHLALLAWARGEMVEAVEFLERALRIDTKVRAARPRGLKLAALGAIRIDIGDFEGAYANLADAQRICRDNQERVGLAEVELAFARLKIMEKNYKVAAEILEGLGHRSVVSESRILSVWHRQLTVTALIGEDNLPAALKLADEAARIALEAGMNGEAVHGAVLQGLSLAYAGRSAEAVSVTRRATDMLAMLRKVRNAEQVWWYQAQTFQKLGDTYLAKRALAEAVNQVEKKRRRLRNHKFAEFYDHHPLVQAIQKGL